MNQSEIKCLLNSISDYIVSLPKDYMVCSHGKDWEKEYRHGRKRKVWRIEIRLTRSLSRPKSSDKKCHKSAPSMACTDWIGVPKR